MVVLLFSHSNPTNYLKVNAMLSKLRQFVNVQQLSNQFAMLCDFLSHLSYVQYLVLFQYFLFISQLYNYIHLHCIYIQLYIYIYSIIYIYIQLYIYIYIYIYILIIIVHLFIWMILRKNLKDCQSLTSCSVPVQMNNMIREKKANC